LGSSLPEIVSRHGDFEDQIIKKLHVARSRIVIVASRSGEKLPEPESIAGAVITGSHAMVTDRESWSEYTGRWIAQAVKTRIPILGICYGHQLIGQALGGVVNKNPSGGEFGTKKIYLNESAKNDALFHGLSQEIKGYMTHFQSVTTLPPGAVVLAATQDEKHAAFVIPPFTYGFQFHPEFNGEIVKTYIQKYKMDMLSSEERVEEKDRHEADLTGDVLLQRFGQLVMQQDR
jgi:GMP synthase (glutamine-hydrolysing)